MNKPLSQDLLTRITPPIARRAEPGYNTAYQAAFSYLYESGAQTAAEALDVLRALEDAAFDLRGQLSS